MYATKQSIGSCNVTEQFSSFTSCSTHLKSKKTVLKIKNSPRSCLPADKNVL